MTTSGVGVPNIIVVGGGAGGLELVTLLGNALGKPKLARVHLVDSSQTHLWKPLLHEVAVGSLDTGIHELSYREHAYRHGFSFHLGTMDRLFLNEQCIQLAPLKDTENKLILGERRLSFDCLVLAVGSQTNDFGTPGAQKFCYFLDSTTQAQRFHQALINHLLSANTQSADNNTQNINASNTNKTELKLRLGIIGAGATGVELSAELLNAAKQLLRYGFEHLPTAAIEITLIEAGERILPALPQRIAELAHEQLVHMGLTIRVNTKISEVTSAGFLTNQSELIRADLMIWAAGVKAPPFLAKLDLKVNANNQIEVDSFLRSITDHQIFAIGDCAYLKQGDKIVPPRAQTAHQQALYLARYLKAQYRTGRYVPEFRYRDHGSLVSLSETSALGNLMGNLSQGSMKVEGRLARLMYASLYRMHQCTLHGFWRTLLITLFERLYRSVRPKLKLH